MKLIVYADESGTHDVTGTQTGSREAIVAGFLAPREDWTRFRAQWQPYFHFSEWACASAVARNKRTPPSGFQHNPYRGWELTRLDAFLMNLAKIAGSGNKLFLGGAVHTNVFNQLKLKGELPASANPYESCLDQFFALTAASVRDHKAPWKNQPISFFFDQSDDPQWTRAVTERFHFHKAQYPRFQEVAFADKKQQPHVPLQAADMVAYRSRQITERWVDQDASVSWPQLDEAMFKPAFDILGRHDEEAMRAYFSGQLDFNPPKL